MLSQKLTVIIATKNAEENIFKAVESILSQRYVPKVLIIDSMSNDNTIPIVSSFNDQQVSYVSEIDGGIYDAFNKGIRLVTTQYYMIIGSDDCLTDNASEIIKNSLDAFKKEIIFFSVGQRKKVRPWMSFLGAGNMVPGHSCGMIIDKSVHDKIGFYDTNFKISGDALFIKEIFRRRISWVFVKKQIGNFSSSGISNTKVFETLAENFRVQLLTEKFKFLQFFLYLLKLVKNYKKL